MSIEYKKFKVYHWNDVPKKGAFEVEWANGHKEWWLNGQQHRIGGPAVEYTNGTKEWYLNGIIHRIDGPAIEYASGSKAWYLNGKCYLTEKEYWLELLDHELISKEEAFELCLSL